MQNTQICFIKMFMDFEIHDVVVFIESHSYIYKFSALSHTKNTRQALVPTHYLLQTVFL